MLAISAELFANTHIHEVCRHPEYSSVHSRIATFVRWPRHILQRPQDLAEAGLYYTGNVTWLSKLPIIARIRVVQLTLFLTFSLICFI
jgi:hypothetical protein